MSKFLLVFMLLFAANFSDDSSCSGKQNTPATVATVSQSAADTTSRPILTGAQQLSRYLPLLTNKKVGLVVNPTSMVGNTHLVDTLLASNIKVKKIFAPEHGFRGKADAGETVNNETDSKTGLPIISLYGNNKKPSRQQLQDLDVLVFDIQDVGIRFYTYISTLHYLMEACAENNKELLILDRPNPNGHYVDGPVLDMSQKSFVGMHPVPLVHGLTIAELAQMINGEKWLDSGRVCKLKIIGNKNYSHKDSYSLPIKPSPNLPNDLSIKLYPSLGLFEGTKMSVGRGTEFPFQVIGAPGKQYGNFTFTPKSIEGMSKNPPFENQLCHGIDLRKSRLSEKFSIQYVIDFYNKTPEKETYFNNFFNKLAGNTLLKDQIRNGQTAEQIKNSWIPELTIYKEMRKKYLLYPDFE